MSWTDERIERLKEMWTRGMTASQIADDLGAVSRNAVIGKAHRLGLQPRPSPVRPNDAKPSDAKPSDAGPADREAAPAPAAVAPADAPEAAPWDEQIGRAHV